MRACGKALLLVLAAGLLLGGAAAVWAATERVTNGGFESGSGATADSWTFTNSNACDAATCGFAAASGSRYAATSTGFEQVPAMTLNYDIGNFVQDVVVPESPATLRFQLRATESFQAQPPDMSLVVTLGGVQLGNISAFSTSFAPETITIPPGQIAAGSQTLEFHVFCSNETPNQKDCWRIDVDDVSIVTGAPPAAPTITGTDPPSPSNGTHPFVKGALGAGSPTQVKIFTNGNCSGTPSATGSAADFTGAGISVAVPADSTTSLSASATNPAGDSTCSNSIQYVSQSQPPAGGGGPTPGPIPPAPGPTVTPDTTAPVLTALRVNPNAFSKSAKLSYTLSEAADVTFKLDRVAKGRRVGSKCKVPTRSNRKKKACTYFSPVAGSVTKAGVAGKNSFPVTKRWKGHALAPGSYRLRVQAVDAAGNASKVKTASFRVKPGR